MRTPSEWTKNLKENTITEEMVDAALFSLNKRAKNYRDKKRGSKYDGLYALKNREKYEEKEQEYYYLKSKILKHFKPICIHEETQGYERNRVYDYEPNFDNRLIEALSNGLIAWSNSYVTRDDIIDDWYWIDNKKRVYFFDEINTNKPIKRHYLFYRIGEHSYHEPILPGELKKYRHLPIIKIGTIKTEGRDASELYSVQFAKKIVDALDNKNPTVTGIFVNDEYLELLADMEEDEFLNEDKELERVYSNNIENALSFWGEYLLEIVATRQKPANYDEVIEKKPELASQYAQKYRKELTRYLTDYKRNNLAVPLSDSEKKCKSAKTFKKKIRKRREQLKHPCRPKNSAKKRRLDDTALLYMLFEADEDIDYFPIDFSTVAEMSQALNELIESDTNLTGSEEFAIKEKIYNDFSKNFHDKMFAKEYKELEYYESKYNIKN